MNRLPILLLLLAGCVSRPTLPSEPPRVISGATARASQSLVVQQPWTNSAIFVYPAVDLQAYRWQLQSTTNGTDWADYNLPMKDNYLISMPLDRTNAIRLFRMHGVAY